jgi:hypothetical protein
MPEASGDAFDGPAQPSFTCTEARECAGEQWGARRASQRGGHASGIRCESLPIRLLLWFARKSNANPRGGGTRPPSAQGTQSQHRRRWPRLAASLRGRLDARADVLHEGHGRIVQVVMQLQPRGLDGGLLALLGDRSLHRNALRHPIVGTRGADVQSTATGGGGLLGGNGVGASFLASANAVVGLRLSAFLPARSSSTDTGNFGLSAGSVSRGAAGPGRSRSACQTGLLPPSGAAIYFFISAVFGLVASTKMYGVSETVSITAGPCRNLGWTHSARPDAALPVGSTAGSKRSR